MLGREYKISTQDNYIDLFTRKENVMLLAKRLKEQIISEISINVQRCNFIIHKAYSNYEQIEYGYMLLSDMSFKVSLIEKNGQIHNKYNHVMM